jgi:hypothetical protein
MAFVFTPFCAYGTYLGFENLSISHREARATGTMVRYHPEDHARYDYIFTANSQRYSGRGGYPNDKIGGESLGKSTTIYYDPRDPTRNSTSSFLESARMRFIYPFLWLVLLVVVGMMARLDYRRKLAGL